MSDKIAWNNTPETIVFDVGGVRYITKPGHGIAGSTLPEAAQRLREEVRKRSFWGRIFRSFGVRV